MAIAARRKSDNIRRSIAYHLERYFESPNLDMSGRVSYNDLTFDASDLRWWAVLQFLDEGAGEKRSTMFQVSLHSRVGGRTLTGDRFGNKLSEMADWLRAAFAVDSIQVYNFSTPTTPTVITNAKLVVVNGDGTFREPEDDTTIPPDEDGVAVRTVTYSVRTIGDLSAADRYYD